jgi:hypothetical protein
MFITNIDSSNDNLSTKNPIGAEGEWVLSIGAKILKAKIKVMPQKNGLNPTLGPKIKQAQD